MNCMKHAHTNVEDAPAGRLEVPYFRPQIQEEEIAAVVSVLRSGWLTTGRVVKEFETEFSHAVGAAHAIAVNSCTAALHLAVDALGLTAGQGVLVPAMTFAATAEVVRYQGAIPILVDCDATTGNMDLTDAARRVDAWRGDHPVVGLMPVHVGGLMLDIDAVHQFAAKHGLWIVEDAAHAFPAAWRPNESAPWQRCGEGTAAVTCFSFYANKTITTGEGGMAVTDDAELASRMRLMSLHGLSQDAWNRYKSDGNWDYQIVAPGYKYNLTDVAGAIGLHQLRRAEAMRLAREQRAVRYRMALSRVDGLELPAVPCNRLHAWHLFQIQLTHPFGGDQRKNVLTALREAGITCAVHWRPLHMHPYYREMFNLSPSDYPNAARRFERTISLPLYPSMTHEEVDYVAAAVMSACARTSV
jgi:dTDP-4-amino-4,6-dideoxygalactose transaminase